MRRWADPGLDPGETHHRSSNQRWVSLRSTHSTANTARRVGKACPRAGGGEECPPHRFSCLALGARRVPRLNPHYRVITRLASTSRRLSPSTSAPRILAEGG